MTKLNHDSELYTSLCRQWWPIEVSKLQWPWRSGQSPANRDGADVEGMMTMEVVAGMVVGEGVAPDLEEKEAKQAGMVWCGKRGESQR
jgi:hypothetical protein